MDQRTLLEQYALKMLNLPYRWGGDNALSGYDCSGLVIELLKSQGMFKATDATAAKLAELYPAPSKPQFGALAFFGTTKGTISHVAMCLNDTQMIEAGGGDSSITSKAVAEESGAWIRIRPIYSGSRSPVAITIPPYIWLPRQ